MNGYEKLIMIFRDEAKKSVPGSSYGLAVMTGDDTLSYNGLELDSDDVVFADYLTKKRLTKLDFEINQEEPLPESHHNHEWTDKSTYIKSLKEGDVVFGIMLDVDDEEKFLVLCRIGG